MNSFSIKYQTAEVVPAPFSYAIEISGEIVFNQELELSFELTYLDRNPLTLEEIEEEGFTENDNFQWKGSLPKIWNDILLGNLKSSKPMTISLLGEVQDFWEIKLDTKTFYPANIEDWKYLVEEIQQAVFEKAGRELPMKLSFLKIEQQQNRLYTIEASFEKREIILQKFNATQPIFLDWNELNYILKNIYSCDFIEEKVEAKIPTQNGNFLNLGDEFWFEFGKSIKGNLKKIEQIFTS
jgi:hypothetical protein